MTAATRPATVAAVLVAAGSGQRLGAATPKAFVDIGGLPLYARALRPFAEHPGIRDVVLVVPAGHDITLPGTRPGRRVTRVTGGATRTHSVRAGLDALAADVEFVLVHDVARPFVPSTVVDGVLEALRTGADAVVPVLPIHDTVRRVAGDGSFAGTVDRTGLVAVQTPQGFRRQVLLAAHEAGAALQVTDDAALVEAAGGLVVPVAGDEASFKITTPADLARAQAMALGSVLPTG